MYKFTWIFKCEIKITGVPSAIISAIITNTVKTLINNEVIAITPIPKI